MAYAIDRYNNTLLTTVEDGTVDQTTDLKFIGKNYAGYGEIQNENFVHLLENFSGETKPPRPLPGQLWYDRDPSTVSWATAGSVDFVKNCTVEGSNNQDDILILGDIYVRQAIEPNNLVLNDIRVQGGGIREDLIEESINTNPEVEWYWDISQWDGKSFPGMASVFIEVPVDLLESLGGTFTPDRIHDITKRHIALGVYPVDACTSL
jgi:hypothetical protein